MNNITPNTEKIFFHYLKNNPLLINEIEEEFFKHKEIKLLFSIIKKEYNQKISYIPNKNELYNLALSTKDIDKSIFESIMNIDMNKYSNEFIISKFEAWRLHNKFLDFLSKTIDKVRDIDSSQIDSVLDAINISKQNISNINMNLNDDSLGLDFDNAESHNQDVYASKIGTGFNTLDTLMLGGFDRQTLGILLAPPNVGKSLWLQNLASNMANLGFNVLIITLEMSEKKVMKRIGSMRLNLPINDYDTLSKDTNYIEQKITELKNSSSGFLYEDKIGKIRIKGFPTGTLTINQLENFIVKAKTHDKINYDVIMIDYVQLMACEKTAKGDNNLYLKGKELAEGLRSIAQKENAFVCTPVQTNKDGWNNDDLNLTNVSESKAIVDTADYLYAIIRTDAMKLNSVYILKALKMRDVDFNFDRIKIKINRTTMKLYDDEIISTTLETEQKRK